jgi:hypothetical protein
VDAIRLHHQYGEGTADVPDWMVIYGTPYMTHTNDTEQVFPHETIDIDI